MARAKLISVSAAVAVVLALAVGAASANRLSVSNSQFRFLMRSFELTSSQFEITCGVTLEGSFHSRTFAKVQGALVGFFSRASVDTPGCTGGRMSVLAESLPWHVRYRSFSGTLPAISAVALDVVGFTLLFENTIAQVCLYRATEASPMRGRFVLGEGGTIQRWEFLPEALIPLFRKLATFPCPENLMLGNLATVSLLGTTTALTLRLI